MLLSALLVACATGAPPPAAAPAEAGARGEREDIDVATLKARMDAGQVSHLVDVRTPAEFARGAVPGAINLPVQELQGRLAELDAARAGTLYVICHSGARSSAATDALVAAGYQRVVNVTGGTAAWTGAGYPVQ